MKKDKRGGGLEGRKSHLRHSVDRSRTEYSYIPTRFVKRLFSPCSIVQGGALLGVAQILVDHTYPTIDERRESDLPLSKFALSVMR
jgi:hypothetical protein